MSTNIMQQINLYQAEFKPKIVLLPAFQMLFIVLFVLALMLLLSFFSHQKIADADVALTDSQHSYQANQQKLLTLQEKVKRYSAQISANNELNVLQQQLREKQAILNYLNQDSLEKHRGFSMILASLSQHHIANIWLTEFSILDNGKAITLQGKSSQSKTIPEYIDSLAQSEQFHGKQFSVFQMQHPEGNSEIYDFKLTSQPSKKNTNQ